MAEASGTEAALARLASIPRDADGPTFPAPWAARAFALTVALADRGVVGWDDWSRVLGSKVALIGAAETGDAEAYWRAWLAALEEILGRSGVAAEGELATLRDAWLRAAAATPHGEPIELAKA